MFIAEWEVIGGKTTICDKQYPSLPNRQSPDIKLTFEYLEKVIDYASHGRSLQELNRERLIINLRNKIRHRAYVKFPQIKDFDRLSFNHPNNRPLNNKEFSSWLTNKSLKMPNDFPERLTKRDKYLLFVPQSSRGKKTEKQLRANLMVRIEKKGGDPYLGQPLAFDFIFCRLGPTTFERDISLVIDLSVLNFEDLAQYHKKIWENSPLQYTDQKKITDIPTYTMYLKEGSAQVLKNVLKIYAFAADVIVYRDTLIYF